VLERHPEDGWTLAFPRAVSPGTHRVLVTLADAIIPDSPRTDTTLEDVVRHALVSLQYMPRSSGLFLIWSMRALNWLPLWRLRGLRPLTALPTDGARAHLRAATRSRWLGVRLLLYGPLGLFMSSYFDQDYVHRELQYDPVPFVEERIVLRKRWLLGQEPRNADEVHPIEGRTP
jgi:hypothetical protein